MILEGFCPACGEDRLEVEDGRVQCMARECERPDLLQTFLRVPDQHQHVVIIDDRGWVTEHPVMERVEHSISDCDLTDYMRDNVTVDPAAYTPGRYFARRSFVEGWVLIPQR